MGDRFEVSELRCGMLPGLQPLIDRTLRVAGGRQVIGEQLGLAFDEIGKMRFQRRRDARVQFLPPAAQQGRVGSVLHQRMLEQVNGIVMRCVL